jgi:dihydroneopterin aldolase
MSDIEILVKGLSAFGYHGVFEHEKVNGQEFIVDLEITYQATEAIKTDEISKALDYGEIVNTVKALIENTRRDLIEVLADEIAATLLEFDLVKRVVVTLHKPQAPVEVKVADIAVRIVRSR